MEHESKNAQTENQTLAILEYSQLVYANVAFLEELKHQIEFGLVSVETIVKIQQFLNRTQRMIESGQASGLPQGIYEDMVESQKLMLETLALALNIPARLNWLPTSRHHHTT